MPDFTPLLNLPFPGEDDPADAPADLERLARAIEALIAGTGGIVGGPRLAHPGDIKLSAALNPPDGWLLCNGQAVSRAGFPALFAAIGVAYGTGDGSTTFNLPNLQQRIPRVDWNSRGWAGGADVHQLAVSEMPSHDHGGGVWDPGHVHALGQAAHAHPIGPPQLANSEMRLQRYSSGQDWYAPGRGSTATGAINANIWMSGTTTGVRIYSQGGNASHNNLPRVQNVNAFIKT